MKIDHLVYAVPNFEKACAAIEKLTGAQPVSGGYHKTQGTKNALLNLDDGCYFEILAIDAENENIAPPRWMGIDFIHKPTLTRWAVKSENMEKESITLEKYNSGLGEIMEGQRKTESGELLKWKMTKPLAEPEVEVVPFLLNWEKSDHHPSDKLPPSCKLLELNIGHPQPEKIQPVFQKLNLNLVIKKTHTPQIIATIKSPNGIIKI
jgi:hypothetical protein